MISFFVNQRYVIIIMIAFAQVCLSIGTVSQVSDVHVAHGPLNYRRFVAMSAMTSWSHAKNDENIRKTLKI